MVVTLTVLAARRAIAAPGF